MTEKQFKDTLYNSLILGGMTLEDFKAAKKMQEVLDDVLSKKEASVLLTVTFSGYDKYILEEDDNVTEEEAREIYDAAVKKIRDAVGVES